MPTRTIYVKDEKLWKEAKKLAGNEGLSNVIGQALADFVKRKRAEADGFQRHRIAVGLEPSDEPEDFPEPRHTDRIAFEGKRILTGSYDLENAVDDWSKEMVVQGAESLEVSIDLFRTRGGKLVLTADTSGGEGVTHWKDYDSLASLSQDRIVQALRPADRAQLLDEISAAVGDDWARWID